MLAADTAVLGSEDARCKKLAELYSIAVDFPKVSLFNPEYSCVGFSLFSFCLKSGTPVEATKVCAQVICA